MNRVTTPTFGSALISRTHRIENASECETCTIDTFIAETISDQWKDPIDQIRAAQSKDEATTLKKELLGVFMLSGVFTGRAKDKFVAHSGCLCIDCDGVSDPVALRDKLARDRHTYFACLSPSGKGVKALVRIHPSAERHLASFVAAQRYFLDAYGVKLDASCKDVSRACFACHDPDAAINPQAELLEWDVFGRNGESQAATASPKPYTAAAFAEPQETSKPLSAIWPKDSIIEDFVILARRCSESEDQILVGSFLPVISACLGRNIFIDFGGRKYPNLYNILVTRPGLRKTTTINLAAYIARSLLLKEAFVSGITSNQALFLYYLRHPDKLWLIDEGNVILANWAHDAAGKQVAKQVLTLHDCSSWVENYVKHKEEEGEAIQEVAQTSTSILIGTTFSSARFSALETRDGMRRRFNYYVSESFGRRIRWPLNYNSYELIELIGALEALKDLKGEMVLSPEAFELWDQLQAENRRQIEEIKGIDAASETYGSVLASAPTETLKRAMIFEICRWLKDWLKDRTRDWHVIQADTLDLAATHEAYCVAANKGLDTIANRAEIQDEADVILAQIRSKKCGEPHSDGHFYLTRTQLTAQFASHSRRYGAMTPERLYSVIVPDLVKRGVAKLVEKRGKLEVFVFRGDGE
jgi:hypothetical protein